MAYRVIISQYEATCDLCAFQARFAESHLPGWMRWRPPTPHANDSPDQLLCPECGHALTGAVGAIRERNKGR